MSPTRKTFLFLGLPLLTVLAVVIFLALRGSSNTPPADRSQSASTGQESSSTVSWSFDGSKWESSETPPACPNPLALDDPADLAKATAVLYPGQTRGNHYKPHGGFIFANNPTNDLEVRVPLDAYLVKGSRYLEQGELQNLLVFIAPCGISYRFDHLAKLSSKFQAIAETWPEAKSDDSRTTDVQPPIAVTAGEVVATSVGFISNKNVSFDFGVYDLRQTNGVTPNPAWANLFNADKESAPYGVCWLSMLDGASAVGALPAGDQANGKTSDYCK